MCFWRHFTLVFRLTMASSHAATDFVIGNVTFRDNKIYILKVQADRKVSLTMLNDWWVFTPLKHSPRGMLRLSEGHEAGWMCQLDAQVALMDSTGSHDPWIHPFIPISALL